MSAKRFREAVQLHNHSKYSLLDAVPSPQEWVSWCLETGCPGLAISDHGTAISMYDAIRTPELIKKHNKENGTNCPLDATQLIPAVELYVKLHAEDKSHFHITVWAVSNEGYYNLMKLASLAYNDTVSYYGSVKARVTFEQIQQYKEGLMFGTGCIAGPIGQAIMKNKDKALAEERFLMYKEMFGDQLLIEFHVGDVTHYFNKTTGSFDPFPVEDGPDQCVCDNNKQRGYNLFLKEMVDKYGGKCVPVTDAHFILPEDKIIQDCLVKGTPVLTRDRGYVPIESVLPNDMVLTHRGRWRKVEATRGLVSQKRLVELFTSAGNKLTATEDHKIWIRRGKTNNGSNTVLSEQDPEWKQAIDLQVGDAVLLPKTPLRFGAGYSINLSDYLETGTVYSNLTKTTFTYPTLINIDEDVAYFLGMFIGDGHASNGQVSLAIENEAWLDREALDRAIAKFGASWTKKPLGKIEKWTVSVGHLSRWMQHTFYNRKEKVLPPELFYSIPEKLQNKLVRGLYHADGRKKGGSISILMTSYQVVGVLSDWALSRGLFFRMEERGGKLARNKKRGYLTKSKASIGQRFSGRFANALIDILDLHLPKKTGNTNSDVYETTEGFWVRLKDKKVLPASTEPVFDIQVEEDHSFTTSLFTVSNCLLKNGNTNGWYFHESYHQLRSEEMFEKLQAHLGSEWMTEERMHEWIDNTYIVLEKSKSIDIKHEYHLPKIDIPNSIKEKTEDYNLQTYYYMMQLIKKHGRWNNDPVYVERFKQELDVIMKNDTLNFIPYFLVYEDIGSFARSNGILQGLARGSAGGSLISYYLKIVHIDPIKHNLPFERFLSHARIRAGSFPDIDADIGHRERGLIIKYLQEKYHLGFAQIATFQTMKTKNAIKDAMYAIYGKKSNDPEIMAICSTIPDSPQGVNEHDFLYGYTDQEGNYNAGLVEVNKTLENFFKQKPEVERMVKRLIGMVRGWGRHPSAFVISTLDLSSNRVPTMVLQDKEVGTLQVTQYDAPMVEASGLVKADILGLSTLTAVSDCVKLVKETTGIDYLEEENGVPYVYRLPEDKGVYVDFYNKDTDSAFQFNTELIKGNIQEFCPVSRDDLAIMTALCRPGALDAPWGDTTAAQHYLDVRNGKRDLEYLHPDLEPILKDSNGIYIFQEEVMRFLVEIAGYSWEESDTIRSAIAKKKQEVIMASFDRIRQSCLKRGWDDDAIETVCQQILAFSKYSFNKSHSAAYGELGYITMYLKHHHPYEWWASMLNLNLEEDKTRRYVAKLGNIIRPPSLRNPSDKFTVVEENGERFIRAPISAIKGVGPKMVEELVAKGPFTSLEDFVSRIDHVRVNIGGISAMIKGRAADDMMDTSISSYPERRKQFIEEFRRLRKRPLKFKEELFNFDPLSIFLMEKEVNTTFNKTLLSNRDIINKIKSLHTEEASMELHALRETGRPGVPFFMGDVPVLANIKVAEGVLDKGLINEVGMILLYEESSFTKGVSKKSGRPWSKLGVILSDGYNIIECTDWKGKRALGWPKNSIVYVRGRLKPGWKTSVCIDIAEIQRLTKD